MSAPESTSPQSQRDSAALAPRWHTLLLVFVIVFVALSGALLTKRGVAIEPVASTGSSQLSTLAQKYGPLLLVQLGLVGYVARVGRSRWVLRDWLIAWWGPPPARIASRGRLATRGALGLADASIRLSPLGGDALFALAGVGAIAALHGVIGLAVRSRAAGAFVPAILPTTPAERALWTLVVAPCVAFAEEVVYRAYLRVQLVAMTRSRVVACILQALLFGLAHANQGRLGMLEAASAGVVLGALVMLRRSLWPAIFAHVAVDVLAGLSART